MNKEINEKNRFGRVDREEWLGNIKHLHNIANHSLRKGGKGALIQKLFPSYFITASTLYLRMLIYSLKFIGSSAYTVQYLCGKEIGKWIAKKSRKNGINEIEKILELLQYAGWGEIEIIEKRENFIKVKVFNAPLSYAYLKKFGGEKQKLKTEWLEAGIFAGICEGIKGLHCEARETICASEGNDYCEIIIEIFKDLSK